MIQWKEAPADGLEDGSGLGAIVVKIDFIDGPAFACGFNVDQQPADEGSNSTCGNRYRQQDGLDESGIHQERVNAVAGSPDARRLTADRLEFIEGKIHKDLVKLAHEALVRAEDDSPNLGLVVPTMSLGGHGTANMTGNVAPRELATISSPWTSYREAENFKNAYLHLLPLLHFTYSAINPVAVKSLMKALGMPAGELRKPLSGLDAEAISKGLRIVAELGLDKTYGYKLKPLSAVAA